MKTMPDRIWAGVNMSGNKWSAVDNLDQPIKALDKDQYVRADLVGLKCFYKDDLPPKFIAIYSDGSGCDIYYEDGEGSEFYIGCGRGANGVQKDWFTDAGYLWFVPLPDDFEVWEDQKEKISPKIQDKG